VGAVSVFLKTELWVYKAKNGGGGGRGVGLRAAAFALFTEREFGIHWECCVLSVIRAAALFITCKAFARVHVRFGADAWQRTLGRVHTVLLGRPWRSDPPAS
jgi:hypothetical protein